MKVKELIEQLKDIPGEYDVFLQNDDDYFCRHITTVINDGEEAKSVTLFADYDEELEE